MIKKTISQKIQAMVPKIQKSIPEQYNHVKLLDYLTDDSVRLLMSITTRGDGKTYNYLLALIKISMQYNDFKFILLSRHFTLRSIYQDTLQEILMENFELSRKAIYFDNKQQYSIMYVNDQAICLLTELNSATDLKYSSTILKHYRLIVYDEFIALKGDYLPDEALRLKTIYESVARPVDNNDVLTTPKIMLLGNPVNFDSPLLSYFDLYRVLEKQKINTIEKHGDTVIERWKNLSSLNNIKTDMFTGSDDDSSYSGEFRTNEDLVVSAHDLTHFKNQVGVKMDNEQYLIIHYDEENNFYLEITYKKPKKIHFTTVLIGLQDNVKYLDDTYYSDVLAYDHNDGNISYANTFTITQFDNNPRLKCLDYEDMIAEVRPPVPIKSNAKDDEKEIYEEQNKRTKLRLIKEYFSDIFY